MTEELTEGIEVTEDLLDENGHNPMLETIRKILLAGIGAIALSQEEVEKIVNKLIERGEIAEKDGRKLIKDLMQKRRKKDEDTLAGAEDEVESRMEGVMARMNIASKSDIDALSDKISALNDKLDELNQE